MARSIIRSVRLARDMPLERAGYACGRWHAAESETLTLDGHEVTISNPGKIFFADAGITKIDLVRYYLAVADGALVGVRDRPMALKRFVDGAEGEAFFQKRAPKSVPEFVRTVELSFPSGRTADEVVVDNAAALAWVVNLGCIDLNPHPVRSGDLDHPDELRVDLDPGPGVPWADVRSVALVVREVLEELGYTAWPKTSGSRGIHVYVRIEPRWGFSDVRRAALALAREVERRAPGARDQQVVEGGAPRRLPRLQPERQGPHRRVGLLGAPAAGRHGQRAADLGRGARRRARRLHPAHRAGALRAGSATSAPGSRSARTRSSRCSSWSRATRRRGSATRHGRRTTPSSPASRRACSRRSAACRIRRSWRRPTRPRRAAAPARSRLRCRRRRRATPDGTVPPTGRRRSTQPLLVISQAADKADALAGLDRWRARHPEAAASVRDPRTCWWTPCAAATRCGGASASTCATCPRTCAPPPSRRTPTTTRGPT